MTLYELTKEDYRYQILENYVKKYLVQKEMKIISVEQVSNVYHDLKYLVKKQEMAVNLEGVNRSRPALFHIENKVGIYLHATDRDNVEPIIKENLDWRRARNIKFGSGVSFTKSPFIARKYCKNSSGPPFHCALIVCEVLEGYELKTIRYTDRNDEIPIPPNLHSFQNEKKDVLVKVDDYTFNPKFIVSYDDYAEEKDNDWSHNRYSDELDFLLTSEDQDYQTRQLCEELKKILQIPHKNKYEDLLDQLRVKTQPGLSRGPNEAEISSRNSEQTEPARYGGIEPNEQASQVQSKQQIDVFSYIVSTIPSTWIPLPESDYEESFSVERLRTDEQEYQLIAQDFPTSICGIARVQNPFQLALFKISKAEAVSQGLKFQVEQGYHIIYYDDIEIALKTTLDYRRYQCGEPKQLVEEDDQKEPRFYTTIEDAVAMARATEPHQRMLILICDILRKQSDQKQSDLIPTVTQADYNINYVVFLQQTN